ncbi:MAG: redoxin domain-containing protein [Patescibacteria group bacterium]
MLKIGDSLPAKLSTAAFQNDKEIKIDFDKYRGKWLAIIFYPADFTFVCPTELEEAAHLYPEFKKLGAEVMSVSTDTVFVHKAWHDHSPAIKKIKFPMLADPTGKLCQLFGTYIEEEGLSLRGSFLINPEGKLVVMEINHNDIGRNGKELLRKLQAAKFVNEHKGLVCPASWEPGKKTLKPGMDLVGEI